MRVRVDARGREEPEPVVAAQSFHREAARPRERADRQQLLGHADDNRPSPWGKVKPRRRTLRRSPGPCRSGRRSPAGSPRLAVPGLDHAESLGRRIRDPGAVGFLHEVGPELLEGRLRVGNVPEEQPDDHAAARARHRDGEARGAELGRLRLVAGPGEQFHPEARAADALAREREVVESRWVPDG